jgi:hypothetical protein
MQHALRLFVLVAVLLSAVGGIGRPFPVAQAAPAEPTPEISAIPEQLDCQVSPFGARLRLGIENEIILGAAASFTGQPLVSQRLDYFDGVSLSAPSVGSSAGTSQYSFLRSVAADFNGDSFDEVAYVSYNSSSLQVRVADANRNSGNPSDSLGTIYTNTEFTQGRPQWLSVAAGDVSGTVPEGQDLVVVTGGRNNGLNVRMGAYNNGVYTPTGEWGTNVGDLNEARYLDVVVAEVNGDGVPEILVSFMDLNSNIRIAVLEYVAGHSENSTPAPGERAYATNLRLHSMPIVEDAIGDVLEMHIAAGNVDGDIYRDEVVVGALIDRGDGDGFSQQIRLYALDQRDARTPEQQLADEIPPIWQLATSAEAIVFAETREFQLALGDLDASSRSEIVLAYRDFPSFQQPDRQSAFTVRVLDLLTSLNGDGQIAPRLNYFDTDPNRLSPANLSLAIGDLNRDGWEEAVVAFREGNNGRAHVLTLTQLPASTQPNATPALRPFGFWRGAENGPAFNLTMSLGDWNNDSYRAVYGDPSGGGVDCRQVVEPNMSAVVFAPPRWAKLQGNQNRSAFMGASRSTGKSRESSLTVEREHSVSAYVGVGVGAEFVGVKFEAQVKATAGYARSQSETRGSSNAEDTVLETGVSSPEGHLVLFEEARYNCYLYGLRVGEQVIDGSTRTCEHVRSAEASTIPEIWDATYGPSGANPAPQWTPIVRDWANLALSGFGAVARASANVPAANANNGRMEGASVVLTGNQPWWQVDLGLSQPLNVVRVWEPLPPPPAPGTIPSGDPAEANLADFYVFVSSVDPATISNNPDVLRNDPRVWTYRHTGPAGRVTNIQTWDNADRPVQARYIRVQLAGAGTLPLAEVQAFGGYDIDPDRYPVSVGDENPNDAYFEVMVPDRFGRLVKVPMRGALQWNHNVRSSTVGSGGTEVYWSRSTNASTTLFNASSIGQSASVGAEFDVEFGAGAKILAGGGYQFTTGTENTDTRSLSWGSGLEFGGSVQGFPSTLGAQFNQCAYQFRPFVYSTFEQSSIGYTQGFMAVDYLVPADALSRTAANLDACRATSAPQPIVETDVATGAPGSAFILTARGFNGGTAQIELRKPGEQSFSRLATLQLSANGELVFVLVTAGNDPIGAYSVRITSGGATALAQSSQATTSFTLAADAPVADVDPTLSLPSVGTDGTTTTPEPPAAFRVYLPLVRR